MNLGEFREKTKHLPDDADLVVDMGDGSYWEIGIGRSFLPVLEHPWTLALEAGSEVTMELDLHHRDGSER